MVTTAQAVLELHIPHQSVLVSENKVQHSTSLIGSSIIWRRKLSQEPPGFPVPGFVVPPTNIGVVGVPHRDRGF